LFFFLFIFLFFFLFFFFVFLFVLLFFFFFFFLFFFFFFCWFVCFFVCLFFFLFFCLFFGFFVLVGTKVEAGRLIQGKELNIAAYQVVNIVDQQDVISVIFAVLDHWHQGQSIYNVVNPSHPCKRDYYAQKCQQHGGEMPRFTGTDTAERKVLGSAIEALGFSYQYAI